MATRATEQERVDGGRCARCGADREAHPRLCEGCRRREADAAATRYQARRESGLCTKCGVRPAAAGLLCMRDWWRAVASARTGSASHAAAIQRLWVRQGGRCAVSGIAMTPGEGASLDHVVPVSRGGSRDDVGNLRWILADLNRAKGDLLDREFLRMCRVALDGPLARRLAMQDQGEPTD